MVGTFDVENLGDLLFPYIARHELSRRLGEIELELFSYRSTDPPSWPLTVRPVHSLAKRLHEFELLVVGGGHIIRGDAAVAPGYEPTDATTSHPYGLWLTPTFLAASAGTPVAWNAIGAIESVPEALDAVVNAAIGGVDYLAVRDLPTAKFIRQRCATATPTVVPDTVYGISQLLDDASRVSARQVLADAGVEHDYLVVQPSSLLRDHTDAIESLCRAAVASGLAIVELPCGPCHFDVAGRLGLDVPTIPIEPWPEPLIVAAVLSGASAIVASSLHAGIIATASGVPLFRPRAEPGSKYEPLDLLPGVAELPVNGTDAEMTTTFARSGATSQVVAHQAVLQHHWDEIARLATRRRSAGPTDSIITFVEGLPESVMAQRVAEREGLDRLRRTYEDERILEAGVRSEKEDGLRSELDLERTRTEELSAIVSRKSVQAVLLAADWLGSLRRRSTTSGTGRRGSR